MERHPSFDIATRDDVDLGSILLIGQADIGAASLTAVDHLIEHLDTTRVGQITPRNLPDIAPISDGTPRHPIRIYSVDDSPISILIGELFLPVWIADPFTDALFEWATGNGIDEIVVVHGAPFPHNEEEHRVFYAATEGFRRRYFDDGARDDIDPLPGGVLDGVNAELLVRGLDAELPAIGVLITPSHPPGPDFEAALQLLGGLQLILGVDVDVKELRTRSEQMKRYYEALAGRLNSIQQGEQSIGNREFPEDWMYM